MNVYNILYLYLGSCLAVVSTVLVLNFFNIFSDIKFEPFFSPWPWLLIYLVMNGIYLSIFLLVIYGFAKYSKWNLTFTPVKYFLTGLIFSALYVLSQTLLVPNFTKLNNYLFAFVFCPLIIFVVAILSMLVFTK